MGDISHQRVVLVTGASTGIGRLCAERLAASGWRVFGAARSAGAIESAPGSNLDWLPMDVTDDVSVQTAIDTILAQTGRIDAIVNNAGFSMRGSVEDVPMEEARAVFETNFFGALRVCRAAAPALRARGDRHDRGGLIRLAMPERGARGRGAMAIGPRGLINARRARPLPALVIPPWRRDPPLEYSDGMRPTKAASCRGLSKRVRSPSSATTMLAFGTRSLRQRSRHQSTRALKSRCG